MADADGSAPPPPPPSLPSYPEMILEAILALGDENGSNKTAISGYIKDKYGASLPTQHTAFLTGHLARMKTTGELIFARNNYFVPDEEKEEEEEPTAPAPADLPSPLRTDGRKDPAIAEDSTGVDDEGPPAPAPVITADASPVPVKRGRGRPPKPKDPVAEESSAVPATASLVAADAAPVPVKRGRGRPPKPKSPAAPVVTADAAATPVKRGPGRPPKLKATARSTSGVLSPRGRPPKKAKGTEEAPTGAPAAAPGGAADASAVPIKRGRGRPPKVRPTVVKEPSES